MLRLRSATANYSDLNLEIASGVGLKIEFVAIGIIRRAIEIKADRGRIALGFDLVDRIGKDAENVAAGQGLRQCRGESIGVFVRGRSVPDVIDFGTLEQGNDRPAAMVMHGRSRTRCPGHKLEGQGKFRLIVEGFDRPSGIWIRCQRIEVEPGRLFEQLLNQGDDSRQLGLGIVDRQQDILDFGEKAIEPIGPLGVNIGPG